MSLDVDLMVIQPTSIFSMNITHNLGKMAQAVVLENGKTLYDVLWRPEEHNYFTASDITSRNACWDNPDAELRVSR
jgi:hypothetical protein